MNSTSFYDWYQPKRPLYYPSTFPAENFQPIPTTYSKPSPKKIVSIPVRFVRSESTISESALQIQKVFRGFMARLRVKQLMALKREVDEVESRISNSDTLEILRIDAKERLRLNERLMSLLLKLDSVRGTVSGVRDCRKAVIKKAIALQERIDAIVVTTTEEQTLEMKQSIEERISNGSLDTQAGDEEEAEKDDSAGEICSCEVEDIEMICRDNASESSITAVEQLQSGPTAEEGEGRLESEEKDSGVHSTGDEEAVRDDSAGEICKCVVEAENVFDIGEHSSESSIIAVEPLQSSPTAGEGEGRPDPELEEEKEDSCDGSACYEEAVKDDTAGEICKCEVEAENAFDIERICRENRLETSNVEPLQSCPDSEENSGDHSVEVAEGFKEAEMKDCGREKEKLMEKLLEKNEVQVRMIRLLTERVERLERAFLCEKLQKMKMKKKKNKKKWEQRRC